MGARRRVVESFMIAAGVGGASIEVVEKEEKDGSWSGRVGSMIASKKRRRKGKKKRKRCKEYMCANVPLLQYSA